MTSTRKNHYRRLRRNLQLGNDAGTTNIRNEPREISDGIDGSVDITSRRGLYNASAQRMCLSRLFSDLPGRTDCTVQKLIVCDPAFWFLAQPCHGRVSRVKMRVMTMRVDLACVQTDQH